MARRPLVDERGFQGLSIEERTAMATRAADQRRANRSAAALQATAVLPPPLTVGGVPGVRFSGTTGSIEGGNSGQAPEKRRSATAIVEKLREDVAKLQASRPNWSNDGKTFTVRRANGAEVVLEVAAAPGPGTPSEEVHEVLGQPEMLFAVAFAISTGKHFLLQGPTGVAKTTMCRWLAKQLNWNFVLMPISRGTEAAHLVGEYLPADKAGVFKWTYGPVSTAALASQSHPTLLVFDELNRIGNIAELARIYSLLDDSRMLEMKEKRDAAGGSERIDAGRLYIGATANPADDERADYTGVQELDPALLSRFGAVINVGYPAEEVEALALTRRVADLDAAVALQMVQAATRIRRADDVRFPISFRELEAWALTLPHYGLAEGAELAVVSKAHPDYRPSIRDLLKLQPRTANNRAGVIGVLRQ